MTIFTSSLSIVPPFAIGVLIMLSGHLKSPLDRVHVLFWCRDPFPGLFLEGMKDIKRALEPNGIDCTICIAVITRHDFQYVGGHALKGLGVSMLETDLSLIQSKSAMILHAARKRLQILFTRPT